jgi:predicted PurR-regulated permease PerM
MANAVMKYRVASTPSQKIVAAGVVIAICYFGASIVVTILVSILLAYFLDPAVSTLEKIQFPRGLASLIMVLVTLTVMGAMCWVLVARADEFGRDWPHYRAPLRKAIQVIDRRLTSFESRVSEIEPPAQKSQRQVVEVAPPVHPVRAILFDRLQSVYPLLMGATFIPFLVFFMLAAKRQVWYATIKLFPVQQRSEAEMALEELSAMLRGYVIGILVVCAMLVAATWAFFWYMGFNFPFIAALISGILNIIPYIGLPLAWIPPFVIGLGQFSTPGIFIGTAAMLTALHLASANLLFPAFIGRRLHLNAVALTISLLFWGWLWGAIGLLLAIPITAAMKVVCDHVKSWQPFGQWLGA